MIVYGSADDRGYQSCKGSPHSFASLSCFIIWPAITPAMPISADTSSAETSDGH